MVMKIFKDSNNRIGTPLRRFIGLFLTSCFFLGFFALAMHHHDALFQLKSCAICKAKTSYSGALNKINADPPLSIATTSHCSGEIYSTFSRMKPHYQTPFIASLLPSPFSNKAPPFIS
jgi:hypothetical protein